MKKIFFVFHKIRKTSVCASLFQLRVLGANVYKSIGHTQEFSDANKSLMTQVETSYIYALGLLRRLASRNFAGTFMVHTYMQ